ncbi:hypothetical protein OSB04_012144 [Centaurea solstitialis]|uniref:Uncharacterized protein n=1 Tax=Centaurea solstitialis TaxID=347529 RepID=A0AA38TMK4_9ASTR|nr:hypothetical protein OSB04_012144 [Centaurea solstitialis]
MDKYSVAKTPKASGTLIGADPKGKPVDQKTYRAIIGSLLYLTASRPDIMFSTCFCAGFQANPMESHMMAVKRILRYLKGTLNRGLWYPKESGFELVSFSDVDHGGCQLDRKSTSGHVQFLGDKLDSWSSKKQHCVSTSTTEAEYVAAASCCSQVLWMRTQLRDYGYNFNHIPIYCDSKSAIAITCNTVQHTRTKHIHIRYHFIKDHVERGTIELYFVKTEYQLADLFTKPLDEKRFNFLISKLGGTFPPHACFEGEHCLSPPDLGRNRRPDQIDVGDRTGSVVFLRTGPEIEPPATGRVCVLFLLVAQLSSSNGPSGSPKISTEPKLFTAENRRPDRTFFADDPFFSLSLLTGPDVT